MNKTVHLLLVLAVATFAFTASNSFSQNDRFMAENGWHKFMASATIGQQLRDQSGNDVAEIRDLVIDSASGRVSHIILSQIPGSEAMIVTVPFSTVSETPKGEILVYHPAGVAETYYGQAPYWSEGFYLYANQSIPMGSYEASKLIGATVRASNGEVSQIKDLEIYATYGSAYTVFPF